jgi:hypothetical protein
MNGSLRSLIRRESRESGLMKVMDSRSTIFEFLLVRPGIKVSSEAVYAHSRSLRRSVHLLQRSSSL